MLCLRPRAKAAIHVILCLSFAVLMSFKYFRKDIEDRNIYNNF